MAPKLYFSPVSSASRAILMIEQALNLNLEHVTIDILKGEHLTPEFAKINPHKTVPVLLEEDGTKILDSHVIASYLCDKYATDDSLYPKNLVERCSVQHKLHFDNGNVFPPMIQLVRSALGGNREIPNSIRKATIENYELLNQFLAVHDWVCGDKVTIADLCLLPTVTNLNGFMPIDDKHANIIAWIKRAENLPYYGPNKVGCDMFVNHVKKLLD